MNARDPELSWHDIGVRVFTSFAITTARQRIYLTRGRHRLTAVTAMLMTLGMALSGCSHQQHLVGDRLWGEIVVATKDTGDTTGPQVTIPESMRDVLSTAEYKANGMIGSRVTYQQITLGQFNQLGDIVGEAYPNSSVTMYVSASRSGDVVRMRGNIDLTPLVQGNDYVEFGVRFAGPVVATNGTQTGDNTAVWKPTLGQTTVLSAEAHYPDPSTSDFGLWTTVLAGFAVIAVAIVVWLAWRNRDRSERPGAPTRSTT